VRAPMTIAAAFITAGLLGACSKPAPDSAQTNAQAGGRDIRLAETPRTEAPVASALEAPGAARPDPAPAPARRVVVREPEPEPASHDHAAVTTDEPVQELSRTTTSSAEPQLRLAMATAPAAPIFGAARPLEGPGGANDPRAIPNFGTGRGPIMIRGGRGGVDDDCDLHRPGFGRPAAVNRVAPPLGGGFRGGIR
jgi:hypothetical protein